jgi:hypothetical protein
MQAALCAARFDAQPGLPVLTMARNDLRAMPQQEVGLQADRVLNPQDRGHARDAQAEGGEPKGSFRLHADPLSVKRRRGLPMA